jgi:hypothetical protein
MVAKISALTRVILLIRTKPAPPMASMISGLVITEKSILTPSAVARDTNSCRFMRLIFRDVVIAVSPALGGLLVPQRSLVSDDAIGNVHRQDYERGGERRAEADSKEDVHFDLQ